MSDDARHDALPAGTLVTLAASGEATLDVKRSRFVAHAARVDDPATAEGWLATIRAPDANHNTFAWRVGDQLRFSDDGEPGGTAGRPILAAIDGAGLDHVAVVVARWFGGVKLGTGGLVRAYGGTAAAALRDAPRLVLRPRDRVRLHVPFAHTGAIFPLLETFAVERREEAWDTEGVALALSVDGEATAAFTRAVTDASRGDARVAVEGPEPLPGDGAS